MSRYLVVVLVALCGISTVKGKAVSDFQCSDFKVRCGTAEKCIPASWKCDGDDDCGDGSDEQQCTQKTCKADAEFTCVASGKCVPNRWRCDHETDCTDGSDEANCPSPTCAPSFFQCKNGRCIPDKWRCDTADDCGDGSDEVDCGDSGTCSPEEFRCTDGSCISKAWKCDGSNDCSDGTDERNCSKATGTKTCAADQYKCDSGQCIKASWRCDNSEECLDGSDEKGCSSHEVQVKLCAQGLWTCDNGDCIKREWRCDGEKDCVDGSDEKCTALTVCASGQFACRERHQCVDANLRCNGVRDCMDGTDETHCSPSKVQCTSTDFNCTLSNQCVSVSKVCNGHTDCVKGEDEPHNCNINECLDNNGHCTHNCTDLKIGYTCSCPTGYELAADGRSCDDVDECKGFGVCHQLCINIKGSHKCSCEEGFLLEPDHKTCKAKGGSEWVYFSNRVDIRKISSDGTDYRIVVGGLRGVVSIDFHISQKHIYWTDILTDQIQRASIENGKYSEEATVIHTNVHTPDGLAVDWVNEKLYWTDTGYKTIEVSELDGTNNADVVNVGLSEPRAICLDPHQGYIYWTDWGAKAGIERISMDGDNTTREILVEKDIYWPNGLTLDLIQRKVYWIDAKLQRVEACNMDGSQRMVIKGTGFVHPFALDNFEDQLYWTDWKSDKLSSISKFNSSSVHTIKDGLFAPMGIKVYHESKQTPGSSRCVKYSCSHLCLLANHNNKPSYGCRCPRNMVLTNGHTCTGVHKPRTTPVRPTAPRVTPPITVQHTGHVVNTPKGGKKPTPVVPLGPGKSKEGTGDPSVVIQHSTKLDAGGVGGGTMAAIILSIVVVVMIMGALLFYVRRRRVSKGNIMYYKDIARTPLEDDFDVEVDDMDCDKEKVIREFNVQS